MKNLLLKIQKMVDVIDVIKGNDTSKDIQDPDLPIEQTSKTFKRSYNQEILWYLEFDGSVNKLGVGAGVWIHNMQNDHAEGHAYRLNFR